MARKAVERGFGWVEPLFWICTLVKFALCAYLVCVDCTEGHLGWDARAVAVSWCG